MFLILVTLLVAGCDSPPDRSADAPGSFEDGLVQLITYERNAQIDEAAALVSRMRETFGTHPRVGELDSIQQRLASLQARADELTLAIKGLASTDPQLAAASRRTLLSSGHPGRAFLRKALRTSEGRVAVESLKLLVDLKDRTAADIALEKAASTRSGGLRSMLAHALFELSTAADAGDIVRPAYTLCRDDERFEFRAFAGLLCRLFVERLDGNVSRFNELAGEDGAYANLREYVERALHSGDEMIAAWASVHAASFRLMVNGLRGQYYEGVAFEKLAHEQLDGKIEVPERKFPYPDGRQDNISVRWTGFVSAPRGGTYTFYSASDDGQRVWVGGKLVVDDWTYHGVIEKSGTVVLTPGLHPFKVEFMQGGGGASIKVSYQGPGIGKKIIPKSALFTVPWK